MLMVEAAGFALSKNPEPHAPVADEQVPVSGSFSTLSVRRICCNRKGPCQSKDRRSRVAMESLLLQLVLGCHCRDMQHSCTQYSRKKKVIVIPVVDHKSTMVL